MWLSAIECDLLRLSATENDLLQFAFGGVHTYRSALPIGWSPITLITAHRSVCPPPLWSMVEQYDCCPFILMDCNVQAAASFRVRLYRSQYLFYFVPQQNLTVQLAWLGEAKIKAKNPSKSSPWPDHPHFPHFVYPSDRFSANVVVLDAAGL